MIPESMNADHLGSSQSPLDGWEPTSEPGPSFNDIPSLLGSIGPMGEPTTHELQFNLGSPDDEEPGRRVFASTQTCLPSQSVLSMTSTVFPGEGQVVGGFRIVSELGRGAFARVYLAEQVELAGRPVALKVAKALGDEPQALARLQHTHIVPIFSIHDDPATGLRLLCMPFVGGANLAQILERSGARLPTQASGRSLLEALDGLDRPHLLRSVPTRSASQRGFLNSVEGPISPRDPGSPTAVRSVFGRYLAKLPWWKSLENVAEFESHTGEPVPEGTPEDRSQPARRFLRSHTYVQAAVWIAARLAEGLDHAHARGVLHRDIKPSNILIAADGTPMLLDFNLAADTQINGSDEADRAHLGGTLPYMAPEHLDAFNPRGHTLPSAVDERSDIYAVGLILYEMVAGRHPFEEPPTSRPMVDILKIMTEERIQGAPPSSTINSMVPPSLDAIIAKALAPQPSLRYNRAADMAEDLQRFLDDRPNAHAPEPSLRERAGKWWRRHPEVRGAGPVAAAAAVMLSTILVAAWSISSYAEQAQARLARNHFREEFLQAQVLLNTSSATPAHRVAGIERAENLLRAYKVVSSPEWLDGPMVKRLSPPQQIALREDVAELMLLLARARVTDANQSLDESGRRKTLLSAIEWLNVAEKIDPHPSVSLFETRARYYRALANAPRAEADRKRAAATPPNSARDFYLRGTERLARKEYDLAESDLSRAVALDPKRFWAWFTLGLCHFDRGRYDDAVGDFSACTLLSPDFDWPHVNRGLALAAGGKLPAAKDAFDKALMLSPDLIEALINRALVCLQLDKPEQALKDFEHAIRLGRKDSKTLAAKAEALSKLGLIEQAEFEFEESLKVRPDDPQILVAQGMSRIESDPVGARASFERVLNRDPNNARAHYGMGMLLRNVDHGEALKHASQAMKMEPRASDILQLRSVLYGRLGNPAAVADAESLSRIPSPHNLYNAACALCLLDQFQGSWDHLVQARLYLDRALAMGFPVNQARADPDLAPLWKPVRSRASRSSPPAIDTGVTQP